MTGRARGAVALALTAALASGSGCAFAVDHPSAAAGVAGATLGFTTCKLASDSYGSCALVGGGAGAFLALVAATALWLGGDGHTVLVEEQAKPLPDDGRPLKRHRRPDGAPSDAPASGATSPTAPSPEPAPDATPSPDESPRAPAAAPTPTPAAPPSASSPSASSPR